MRHDPVKSPGHYTRHGIQPIAITRHLNFCLGNAVKYVMRAPYKGGAEDLQKALQYLEWEAETPCLVPFWEYEAMAAPAAALAAELRKPPFGCLREMQSAFLEQLPVYVANIHCCRDAKAQVAADMALEIMRECVLSMITDMEGDYGPKNTQQENG